jgi:hypothetical protein
MASLFTFLEAWKTTSKLLEQFGEAYISWKVQKIRSDHEAINGARDGIIKKINLARAQRNQVDIIQLNRALYLIEYAGVQLSKDQSTKG